MAQVLFKRGYNCINPVPGNRYGLKKDRYSGDGAFVFLMAEQVRYKPTISLWFGHRACSYGKDDAVSFEELETELCKAFERVEITFIDVTMYYNDPVKINPK